MIQILSIQRTGGTSLYMAISKTYNLEWSPSNYEPEQLAISLYKNNNISQEIMSDLKYKFNIFDQEDIGLKIKNTLDRIRLLPRQSLDNQDVNLIVSYLNMIYKKIGIVQKTLGLVNLNDDFINCGMAPILCSRYLDQYLSSHIKLNMNPTLILKEYPGILYNHHKDILQHIINILREQPIFSYNMGNIDQFPACCRWIIHSYYSLLININQEVPLVWTGDNSTKGDLLCKYIRKYLGNETGENGNLEINLLNRARPDGSESFIEQDGRWHYWPNDTTKNTDHSKPFTEVIYSILSNISSPITQELTNRIYCGDE
jgi:hypothetical protein